LDTSRKRLLLGTLKLFNLWLMGLSFLLAAVLPFSRAAEDFGFSEFFAIRLKLGNFVILSIIVFIWHLIFSACGLYKSERLATQRSIIAHAAKATTLATVAFVAVAWLFHIRMATPQFVLALWLLSTLFVSGARVAVRYLLRGIRRRGFNGRYMLILGTNSRAIEFAARITETPELGYRILGFVDDEWPGLRSFRQSKHKLCCSFDGLAEYLRRNVVDEVVIYLPLRSFYEHASQVAALCEQHGIMIRFDSDIFNLKIARPRPDDFGGHSHMTTYGSSLDGWPSMAKRVLDLVISFALLLALAPLCALAALIIKLTSEGSVFFKQERIGLNKRRFHVLKFRTMVPNAERLQSGLEVLNEVDGPAFKIKNDPRITPIGRFLRRTSIDELPQLLNVLRGDMSLVGPRPLPVRDYEGFDKDWQRRRFSIRPGITCLWQVNGRSSIPFEQWMRLDLQYLDEWSFWLDIKILARTVPAVLKGSGAV
jgi:exopolysaccharide biosynthesis polyprenyl glycosylphosphotransferase